MMSKVILGALLVLLASATISEGKLTLLLHRAALEWHIWSYHCMRSDRRRASELFH